MSIFEFMNQSHPLVEELKNSKDLKILITTHKSPDGDAIGSSLGLYHFLKSQGIYAQVMVPDAFAHFLHWMPDSKLIQVYDQDISSSNELINQADYVFCLDYNSFKRVGKMEDVLQQSKAKKFLIDHHQQPDIAAEYILSDTSASSTCELVYTFIHKHWDKPTLPVESGMCLYTGLMTDTGSFRFPSSSAYTHRIVAHLLDIGVHHAEIHERVMDQNTADKLKLVGYALNHMEIIPSINTCIMGLTKEELATFNYQKGDTEGLVNYGLSIQGIRLSVLVLEVDNLIKISFRSKGNFSVNELSRAHFEGGGHTNAAGGLGKKSVAHTIEKIKAVLATKSLELNA